MRNRTIAHTEPATDDGVALRRVRVRAARRPSPQLISDGVVASYIHEISDRHRPRGASEIWAARPAVLSPCGG
ncbi:MAG TPA: hypothetical protein VGF81_03550 [Solirubrobacteraceae bacterium]|jgi:hypothetical protein